MIKAGPRVILSTGAIKGQAGTVVIDLAARCITRGSLAVTWPPHGLASFRLVTCFIVRAPADILWHELIDFMYGDAPDGGPLNPRNTVYAILTRRRRLIRDIGLDLVNRKGWGFIPSWRAEFAFEVAA